MSMTLPRWFGRKNLKKSEKKGNYVKQKQNTGTSTDSIYQIKIEATLGGNSENELKNEPMDDDSLVCPKMMPSSIFQQRSQAITNVSQTIQPKNCSNTTGILVSSLNTDGCVENILQPSSSESTKTHNIMSPSIYGGEIPTLDRIADAKASLKSRAMSIDELNGQMTEKLPQNSVEIDYENVMPTASANQHDLAWHKVYKDQHLPNVPYQNVEHCEPNIHTYQNVEKEDKPNSSSCQSLTSMLVQDPNNVSYSEAPKRTRTHSIRKKLEDDGLYEVCNNGELHEKQGDDLVRGGSLQKQLVATNNFSSSTLLTDIKYDSSSVCSLELETIYSRKYVCYKPNVLMLSGLDQLPPIPVIDPYFILGNHYGTPKPSKESKTTGPSSISSRILDEGSTTSTTPGNSSTSGGINFPGAHPSSEGKRRRNRSNVEAMTAKNFQEDLEKDDIANTNGKKSINYVPLIFILP